MNKLGGAKKGKIRTKGLTLLLKTSQLRCCLQKAQLRQPTKIDGRGAAVQIQFLWAVSQNSYLSEPDN